MKNLSFQWGLASVFVSSLVASALTGCGGGGGGATTPSPTATPVARATPSPTGTPTPAPLPGPLPTDRSKTVFYLQGKGSDFITGGGTVLLKPPTSVFSAQRTPRNLTGPLNGVAFSIRTDSASGYLWNADFFAPQGQTLKVGTYLKATRYPFNGSTSPGLSISGGARACNQLQGQFTVRQLSIDASGNVKQFVADFEQACDSTLGSTNKLIGTIRFNSDLNFR